MDYEEYKRELFFNLEAKKKLELKRKQRLIKMDKQVDKIVDHSIICSRCNKKVYYVENSYCDECYRVLVKKLTTLDTENARLKRVIRTITNEVNKID